MGRGGPEPPASGEMDDNSLSPEACYECKINGYPKRGRKRRSTNETDASDIQVRWSLSLSICNSSWVPVFSSKDTLKCEQSPQTGSPVILLALAIFYQRLWGLEGENRFILFYLFI